MSMHEIEDLIESTIRTIDTLDIPSSEKRQLFANCYRAQAYFDTSYTHFRLMEVLLRNDYMQTFRLHNFPPARKYPEYYQLLQDQDFEYIYEHPENDQDVAEQLKDNEIIAVWIEIQILSMLNLVRLIMLCMMKRWSMTKLWVMPRRLSNLCIKNSQTLPMIGRYLWFFICLMKPNQARLIN